MGEWKECKLLDVITLQRGHDLPRSKMKDGKVPVAGSNGIIGYHNQSTTKAPGITIGRSGNLGNAFYYSENFWAHNTTLYVKNFKGNNAIFVYYFLKGIDFRQFNVGSAVPTLNRNHIHPLDVKIPPLTEQKAIASVLSSLDDKIDLLHRQNKTLESMAETLFRQWFVEEARDDWEDGKIDDLFILQRGFDLPVQKRIKGPFPIYAASGHAGGHEEYKVKGPGVTTGRSGVLGKVFFTMEDFWPLNTSLFIKEYKIATPLFSYFLLKTIDIEGFNAGSAVPTLNRNHVHGFNISIPPTLLIKQFENTVKPCFEKIQFNQNQIRTLEKLRDTLLPKLMSGEVRVEYEH
jgi:type I restriction enzyme, S subunit